VKVLLDACVWGGAAVVLRDAGHEVEAVADWPADPGDEEILTRALQASQVLVTLDKDFGELAVVRQLSHHGIIRLVTIRAERQGTAVVEVLAKYGADLVASAIVTVEPNRVRVRPHDKGDEQ
jgi:predicted nuclease of predicted toxin-antitoxin system